MPHTGPQMRLVSPPSFHNVLIIIGSLLCPGWRLPSPHRMTPHSSRPMLTPLYCLTATAIYPKLIWSSLPLQEPRIIYNRNNTVLCHRMLVLTPLIGYQEHEFPYLTFQAERRAVTMLSRYRTAVPSNETLALQRWCGEQKQLKMTNVMVRQARRQNFLTTAIEGEKV
ncbi:hypothetical protein M011DRAFT_471545 [Sporormia fimetaria CBS 119925]|uniref:Uncharacterized protein n=1 Tax=Sporormia fimetaria CBS 119925 TaxID=1340428 RepID=A0A6A6UYD9_9PLEO|nr:hypothetical protein M011DRAFT_471545 [Sporormia fimetaria CBS 119925]